MKKYLFNKIKVDGDSVNFIPFRQANIAESFLANTNLSTNQKDWKFSPSSFKTFFNRRKQESSSFIRRLKK